MIANDRELSAAEHSRSIAAGRGLSAKKFGAPYQNSAAAMLDEGYSRRSGNQMAKEKRVRWLIKTGSRVRSRDACALPLDIP